MTGKKWIIPAILATMLVQALIIGVMLHGRYTTMKSGQQILLKSQFVDPRDLFRGHYVRLDLISGPFEQSAPMANKARWKRGETVYVELQEGEDGFWVPKSEHSDPAEVSGPMLRVEITNVSRLNANQNWSLRVRYPFDRYFAPKERALELENLREEQRLGVIIALDGKGGGVIAGITVDGEKIYDEPLF